MPQYEECEQMIEGPYLLFVGGVSHALYAKTANGIRYWRPEMCKGQLRFPGCAADLDLPDMSIIQAVQEGVKTIVIGVAPAGGALPDAWIATLVEALSQGLDIASGLHTRLNEISELREAAKEYGRRIFDVRYPAQSFAVGSGEKRVGKRLLTVGTDCAVGKMYTALALEKEMRARGFDADFQATGQTGILIAGGGVSVDAVVSDFISGAAEWLSPVNEADHWDVIEGQGSLFHPSYAGVSLGLLHGAQPDALVVCHEAGRQNIAGVAGYKPPDIQTCIDLNVSLGRLTNPDIKCVGVGVNTASLGDEEAMRYLAGLENTIGLACVDPVRTGVGRIVDHLEEASDPCS